MGSLSIWHWLIVIAIVALVIGFGGKLSGLVGSGATRGGSRGVSFEDDRSMPPEVSSLRGLIAVIGLIVLVGVLLQLTLMDSGLPFMRGSFFSAILLMLDGPQFYEAAFSTLSELLLALILAVAAALLIDALSRRSEGLRYWFRSAVATLAAVPMVALFPLVLVIGGAFGNGLVGTAFMGALVALFPLLDRTMPDSNDDSAPAPVRGYAPVRAGGFADWEVASDSRPLPVRIVSLARAGLGLAFTGVIVGEILGASRNSLGGLAFEAGYGRMDFGLAFGLFAAIAVIAALLFLLLNAIERRLSRGA